MARELRAEVEDLLRLRIAGDDARAEPEAAPLEIGVDDVEAGRIDLRDVDRGVAFGLRLGQRNACLGERLEFPRRRRDDPLDDRPLGVERDLDGSALFERLGEQARAVVFGRRLVGEHKDALALVQQVLLSLVLSLADRGDCDQVGFPVLCHGVSPRGCARLRADDRTCQPGRSRALGVRPPSAGRQKLCSARSSGSLALSASEFSTIGAGRHPQFADRSASA